MPLLAVDDLFLSYGKKTIFEADGVTVERGDRLGVVGPNGAGKSTLLKILAGQLLPDGGRITRAKGIRVGYLAQEHGTPGEGSLLASLLKEAPGKDQLEARLAEVEAELAGTGDTELQLELSAELVELHHRLSELDRDFAPHRAERILAGLGFPERDFSRPVAELSGGWRMRAALAALLFGRPDVLLLDEPTNHLDLPSVHWLSTFLISARQTIVLTCHDREFLNRHIDRVASLELEGLRSFRGNYDEYLVQRELDLEYLMNRQKKDERRRKELEAFVERFRAKASKARQAQSKAKMIEKLEANQVDLPELHRAIGITFQPCVRAGEVVIRAEGLRFGWGEQPLFGGLDLTVKRGERIAIVGVNGAGKTTLLKLLGGEIPPDAGKITYGRQVSLAYFAQHHSESLDATKTVLDEVWSAAPELGQTAIRGVCGAFLFSGDDVDKNVAVLSGGEKARVALAKLLVQPGNLLLLDEPTNHLDTESADKLTESLEGYDGSMMFVSHDFHFARRLANTVWDVRDGTVTTYPGTLADYMDKLSAEEAALDARYADPHLLGAAPSAPISAGPHDEKAARMEARESRDRERKGHEKKLRDVKKRIEKLEASIAALEKEQAELEHKLADPTTHSDPTASRAAATRYEDVKRLLVIELEAWTVAEGEREVIEV